MKTNIKEVSTKEVQTFIQNLSTILIDIRPIEAYNGWKINGEARNGHIKGARSLPFKWSAYIDWIEIVRSKNITPSHDLVIYGYDKADIKKVSHLFSHAGYKKVNVYYHFLNEWTTNNDLPMEFLPNYKHLVFPEWIKNLQEENNPEYYEGKNHVICHAHYQNESDYQKGHIPNAIPVDTNKLESPETWNRRQPDELEKILTGYGITKDTTVILYGRFSYPDNDDPFPGSSAGHLGAIRCAFIMLYAGVKDVKVLNGGIKAWEDDGYKLSSETTLPVPVENFGLSIPAKPELAVDTPEAKKILQTDTSELVSVRSWPEYIGKVSGYNYIEKKGRIPGAVFGNCGSDAYHMENYRNLDHTTKEFHEIKSAWQEAGITPDKRLAFYCGTGWRGSEAFFNAFLLGWPKISVYDGGWFEWSNDPDNPYETGIPEIISVNK
jgi:molybdopterin synthase sulfurtransferase